MILFLLKLTLLLATGAALAALLRTRSAATRHLVWSLTLLGTLLLAIATIIAPSFAVKIPESISRTQALVGPPASRRLVPERLAPASPAAGTRRRDAVEPAGGDAGGPLALARSFDPISIWFSGIALFAAWRLLGLLGLARVARRSQTVTWPDAQSDLARPVRVAVSEAVNAPMTWGWAHPIVVLPADASSWSEERRRAAMLHELAHIERNDYLIQLLAGFACALYWFHPVAWFALRRLRRESEQASDDRVLARGTPAPEYATHLLDVARAARFHRPRLLALGMACPSHLETRLRAVLDETRARTGVSRKMVAIGATIVALILVPFARARPELRTPRPAAAAQSTITIRPELLGQKIVWPVRRAMQNLDRIASHIGDKNENRNRLPPFQRTIAASPGETLVLDLETGGGVEVSGWDEPRVVVDVFLGGRDAAETRADVERVSNGVRVHAVHTGTRSNSSTSHRFIIRVPRRFNMRLDSAGGDVSIEDVEGTFEGETGGGGIHLGNVKGRAELSTGGGEIDVDDVDLDGHVSTGGGHVSLKHVRGNLSGTSGTNDVERDDSDNITINPIDSDSHSVTVNAGDSDSVTTYVQDDDGKRAITAGIRRIGKAGGDVVLGDAPDGVSIHTGGGRITVGRAARLVEAVTGGGNIELGPIAGSAYASTGAGNVQITLDDAGGAEQTVNIFTGSGNVVLYLPANLDARFEIETAYTRENAPAHIDSVFELDHQSPTDWDSHEGTPRRYVRAHGTAGNGRGLIKVKAVNGNVTLRRAR